MRQNSCDFRKRLSRLRNVNVFGQSAYQKRVRLEPKNPYPSQIRIRTLFLFTENKRKEKLSTRGMPTHSIIASCTIALFGTFLLLLKPREK